MKIKMNGKTLRNLVRGLAIAAVCTTCVGVGLAKGISNAEENAATVDIGAKETTSYFTASEGVTLIPNVDTPDYIKDSRNALLVQSTSGGTVTYENVVDVSKATKEDLLFSWQPIPAVEGVVEMTQMIIRLEDVENPKSYVNISMRRYTFNDNSKDVTTHVLAQPDSVPEYYGWRYGTGANTGMTHNLQWGTMVHAPWIGKKTHTGVTYTNAMKIYYDNEERAIYTALGDGQVSEYDTDGDGKLLVVDMDDPAHMGAQASNYWKGFPSNKVKISFTAAMVETTPAQYMLYEVDGQSFNGKYFSDVTPPEMTVDQQGYEEDSLPQAVVGKVYPFFEVTAKDKIATESQTKVRVYKDGKELYHTGEGFIPTSAGEYQIEYVASDGLNSTSKFFTVNAVESVTPMVCVVQPNADGLDLSDESLKNDDGNYPISLYYPVKLPEMEVTGGSGNAKVFTSVRLNGKEIPVENGAFTPTEKGEYVVAYTAEDYIGEKVTTTFTAETVYVEKPLLKAPVLPSAILIGKATELPKVNSDYYSPWGQRLTSYDKITVYKADGATVLYTFDGSENVAYTPKASDGASVIVEYSSANVKDGNAATYRKEIALQKSDVLSDRYILEEGVTMNPLDLGIDFVYAEDGKTVSYINPVSVMSGLALEFLVEQDKNSFEEIRFTFTDSLDSSITETISIFKNPDETKKMTSFISLNGGQQREINGSFYDSKKHFNFKLASNGDVTHSDLGLERAAADFAGFESGYVYVEFTIYGKQADEEAGVQIYKIGNQMMSNIDCDYGRPIIHLATEPSGQAKLGSYIQIPKAYASDIYDMQVKFGVTVTFNDKVIYTEENDFGRLEGAKVLAYSYGTYRIEYKATDVSGNVSTISRVIHVRDTIAPTLEVSGDMATTAKVGQKLQFPTVTATDNVDASLVVYVSVIDPMNWYHSVTLDEGFTTTMKGRYVVQFYCLDSASNQTFSQIYYVTVE